MWLVEIFYKGDIKLYGTSMAQHLPINFSIHHHAIFEENFYIGYA